MDTDARDAVVTAWRAEGMDDSTADVEHVVRHVDSLDTAKRTEAIRLLDDSGKDGVQFIDDVSEGTLKKTLVFDVGGSRGWHVALAKNLANSEHSSGHMSGGSSSVNSSSSVSFTT